MKTELSSKSTAHSKNENTKGKREKLKPIQVRRSIKDILIDENPCNYIYNYTGRDISVFPKMIVKCDDNLEDTSKVMSPSEDKNYINTYVVDVESMDSHEQMMMEELKGLLNKEDLSDEMKNNIKSLFIEVQEIYLELKNDIKNNYPSTEDILKLYCTNDTTDKSRNKIWKSVCFYKLLSDQLSDIHISTISSYRLGYLKTIYKWYKKNKKMIFNCKQDGCEKSCHTHGEDAVTGELQESGVGKEAEVEAAKVEAAKVEAAKVEVAKVEVAKMEAANVGGVAANVEGGVSAEEEGEITAKKPEEANKTGNKQFAKVESEDFDHLLKTNIQEMRAQRYTLKRDVGSLCEQHDKSSDLMSDTLDNYIFPNTLFAKTGRSEKGNEVDLESANGQFPCEKERNAGGGRTQIPHTRSSHMSHFDSNDLITEEESVKRMPINTNKIRELEEEIKKQKLLIKKKEAEIINSPIGIKFKEIFGNFQDIDINH
ncbi:conserved Plasmodium protein, unknown function [Plasmodium ovale]|uniref:Uncharacterized protein n=2 Tax=Plasmodium ovale TaxID=36330 RepID=A0A1A8VP13_PLAOA|nr:conserved Plasmodium protein, unknown function [Plasmodium ovale curtisi]SBS81255.1 conserved Plasmodium protein, unknown function [Plasmodium ovale curtisi]SCN43054.1 conserved Plasmodium protein, unknown function [Plasmodium ovale]